MNSSRGQQQRCSWSGLRRWDVKRHGWGCSVMSVIRPQWLSRCPRLPSTARVLSSVAPLAGGIYSASLPYYSVFLHGPVILIFSAAVVGKTK